MTQPTGPATDGAAQGGGEYCSERGNEASLFNRLYFQVFQVFQYLITIPTMQVLQTRCYNAGDLEPHPAQCQGSHPVMY